MSPEIKPLIESNANFSVIPIIYPLIFDSSHSALTNANIYASVASSEVPTRGFVRFRKNEHFYCTGITGLTDTTTLAQSPKLKFIDKENNQSLVQVPNFRQTANDADFITMFSTMTPGGNTEGVKFILPIDHWFTPESVLEVHALTSGVGGTRTIQLAFHGLAFLKDAL